MRVFLPSLFLLRERVLKTEGGDEEKLRQKRALPKREREKANLSARLLSFVG